MMDRSMTRRWRTYGTNLLRGVALLLLLSTVLCLFSGCIFIPRYRYYNDIDAESVSAIAIYDLRDSDVYTSDFQEIQEPLCTLTEDQTEAFLSDLAKFRFSDHILIILAAMDPSFYYGDWVVCIHFTDGGYRLISNGGFGERFAADGTLVSSNHYSCDSKDWEALISKYLPQ